MSKMSLLLRCAVLAACLTLTPAQVRRTISKERLVFQTQYGDIHMAFYPEVAPETVAHIKRLGELGAYNTNHFFRVDKGFVAQTSDVASGRTAPMNDAQRREEERRVPLEVHQHIKHDKRGILSMARHTDPMSGGSSFSILLNPAPHLDMQYTIFGEVTAGLETLGALEGLETRREGIFVMPKERISILSTYVYLTDEPPLGQVPQQVGLCTEVAGALADRVDALVHRAHQERQHMLPGR